VLVICLAGFIMLPMSRKSIKTKAMIFDMDGVITNTMPDHFRAWKEVLAREGVTVTHEDIYSREGQKGIHSVKELFDKYHKKFTPEKAHELLDKKEALFKKIVKTRFIPSSRSFLKKLQDIQIRLALVTGTSRHEMHRILPDNIYERFEVVVTGSDVTHGKPHPEPFQMALKGLDLSAADSMVLENAPFGIRSAKAAGIRCVALATSLGRSYLKEADFIFSSFEEMERKLEFEKDV